MKEYVKIDVTFKERLLFFFSGIIKKENLINNIQEVSYKKQENVFVKDGMNVDLVDDIPDKLDIPFFELDESNIKSNL